MVNLKIRIILQKILKWLTIIILTGLLVGSASALFLWLLDKVTSIRTLNNWLLYLLPILGGIIWLMYEKVNPKLSNGNSLIMHAYMNEDDKINDNEEIDNKKDTIPVLLAPMVLIGTLLTHLGGGSAGREGTAVQMGASIANYFKQWFRFNPIEQQLLTNIGVSAGFAGVFGTPIAAAFFALEFFSFKKSKWYFLLLSLAVAYFADWICISWGIQHAHYQILPFKMNTVSTLGWVLLAGIIFGLASLLFIRFGLLFSKIFSYLPNKPIRPIIGGIILVVVIIVFKQEKMMGLGLDQIADAFIHPQGYIDFLIKMILTTLTLSAGFKGGEVTPLFFIGATLGSVLIYIIPLPINLLAGLGLIALFSGATHCVISAIFLGIELYGWENTLYIVIACSVAYLFSGGKSIYENRPKGKVKKALLLFIFYKSYKHKKEPPSLA